MHIKHLFNAILMSVFVAGCTAPDYIPGDKPPALRYAPAHNAERLLSPAQHNFRQAHIAHRDPVRRGQRAERFELRDGDCGGSDCGNPRARAEIQMSKGLGRRAIGQGIWYGWSFYNQSIPTFAKQNALRLVFGQWTKGGAGQPIIRFIQLGTGEGNFAQCDPSVCDTVNTKSGDLVVQLKDIATAQGWGPTRNDGYVCRILDMAKAQGRWVDMTMHTNFSSGSDGFLRIWVDGRLACNYTGPLVSPQTIANTREIKHRRGVFSSWTKRWDRAQGGAPHPTLVVYYDEFKSGPRRGDVDVAARQVAALKPVD